MKKISYVALFVALWCGFFALPVLQVGCQATPDQRVQTVQTLKIVGQTAKSSVDYAAQLLKQGTITVQQWDQVANFYDNRWQPAYAVAVASAHSDLSSPASPDLIGLASDLASLVAQLTAK